MSEPAVPPGERAAAVRGTTPLAEATHISKRYGNTIALRDSGIVVQEGETHALVGRNGAGKSTLVSILTGLQSPDSGEVRFNGELAPAVSDRDGWRRRVACVYQKSTIIPGLTVAENVYVNRQPTGNGLSISWATMRREAKRLLNTWEVDVDVDAPASSLTVEQRQLVEIARALSFEARFIILDEPTAQLDRPAISRLFRRIRGLQAQGVTFLFISHHLQEIYEICQTVTVYRDAQHILTAPVAGLPTSELVAAMTGDALSLVQPVIRPPLPAESKPILSVDSLVAIADEEPLTFEVRTGEVVGLAGGGGSGKTEVAETIVGLRKPLSGTIEINGRHPKPGSVPSALKAGVGLVPQDRHAEGYIPLLSIGENVTMTVPERLGKHGFLSPKKRDGLARRLIRDLTIKTPGPELPVSALSGGNQQKVVMARALANEPQLLVMINPTAGVDVRSKETLLGSRRRGTSTWRRGPGRVRRAGRPAHL